MNNSAESPETTTSTISTFSPFSQSSVYSFGSEAVTSDEPADLGQFTTVFRALTELQSQTNQNRIAVASNANIHHHRYAPSTTSNISEFSFSGQSSSSAAQTSLGRSSSYRRPREGVRVNTITPTATSAAGRSIRKSLSEDDYDANNDVSQAISGYFSSSSNQDESHYKQSGPSTSTILAPPAPINASSSRQRINLVMRGQSASDQEHSLASETEYDREEAELSLSQDAITSLRYSGSADHPSLGFLDDALSFIAAEREKLAMVKRRDPSVTSRRSSAAASTGRGGGASSQASTNESGAWYSGSPRRRKRRRKRGRHSSALSKANAAAVPEDTSGAFEDPEAEIEEAGEEEDDILEGDVGDGSSSELDNDIDNDYDVLLSSSSHSKGKSLPATPPRLHRARRRQQQQLQQIEETNLGLTSVLNKNITTKAIKEYALLSNSIDHTTSSKNISSSSSRRLLAHSRSTPSLRSGPANGLRIPTNTVATTVHLNTTTSRTIDPRVFRLRTLATKLRILFPSDAKWLNEVLRHLDSISTSATDKELESSFAEMAIGEMIDVRGGPVKDGDPPMHIFIDHSNILIGFLKHLRKYPPHPTRRGMKTHLSHSALALVLERGRPVARRVLATSSPLYQPMDGAERLGYEVRVYVRVPDSGDGADRVPREGKYKKVQDKIGISPSGQLKNIPSSNGYNVGGGVGGGGTSTESDSGGASKHQLLKKMRGTNHSRNNSITNGIIPSNSLGISIAADSTGSPNSLSNKIKYREQGVDELLQLKLLQAIADVDEPPPGSTIVLATGDGNVGQFNEEGFLGCVRTALKKGWCVELYAWEVGLSRAWAKEFGSGSYKDRFRIIGLERYAEDLLEIP